MWEEKETDVACIGGGPASAFAALEILKSKKYNVDIFEEHSEIGKPVNCAGLVSIDGFNKLKIRVPQECIEYQVKGSNFYSPAGYMFKVRRPRVQALVIDRDKFDKYLMDQVQEKGGKIHLKHKVISIERGEKNRNTLQIKKERKMQEIRTKIIIDGEGVKEKFISMMGLSPTKKRYLIPALQYDMKNVEIDDQNVEIYIGRKVAPGFFAYIIPTSENTGRVAVGSRFGRVIDYLNYFINKHPIASKKLKKGTIYKKGGGFIHIGGPIKKTYTTGFLGVGDAVGQVKATTGGGVVFGGLCAKIAGQIALNALENEDYSEKFLKQYQIEWHRQYLRELKLMKLVRAILNALPDKIIDELFLSLSRQNVPELIEEIGDMDMQGTLIKELLFSPRIFQIGLGILTGLFLH
ncbi:MAG: geranylgeranyl reductase family protein [Candidatus Helarchaeota archaeon]